MEIVFVGDFIGILEIHDPCDTVGEVSVLGIFGLNFLEIGVCRDSVR